MHIKYVGNFVFFIGSCFGMMRYATENETYIIPILFSLAGTYYFIKYKSHPIPRYLFFSAWLFAVGVLFHQIHVFWFIGFALSLLIHSKSIYLRHIYVFIVTGFLVVSGVYVMVYYMWKEGREMSLIQFVFHDVYAGQVSTGITLRNFIMTPISFIRTFIQVHGYMKPMLMAWPVVLFIPIAFLVVAFICLKTLFKYSKKAVVPSDILTKAVFWAFILHLCFAFYSVGNAEFMVMLPVLLVLWVVNTFDIPTKPVYYLALVMVMWNMVFGLSAMHFFDLDGTEKTLNLMEKNPQARWILSEPQKVENSYDYYHGPHASAGKVIRINHQDSVSTLVLTEVRKGEVLTDKLGSKGNFDRKHLLTGDGEGFPSLTTLNYSPVDSVEFFGGKRIIYRLSEK